MKKPVFIIAEAGVNHNGSLSLAQQLVDVAAQAGADAVKFQTFKADNLVVKGAGKAEYQKRTSGGDESQWEMLKRLELSDDAHFELVTHCRQSGIQFLSTPFDTESVDFLAKRLGISMLKVPSGEITNAPLLLKSARTGLPVILSTGMATIPEIWEALGVLAFGYCADMDEKPSLAAFRLFLEAPKGKKALAEKVTLLHCTTEYPAPIDEVNLRVIEAMKKEFSLPVGYSDHTAGISVSIAAAALGACIIEKHFTLDKNMPGPDHKASLEPDELRAMVRAIRDVEKALGSKEKKPSPSEVKNMLVARKSLVAARGIQKGERFSEENLSVKRPGTGISPMRYWDFIGAVSSNDCSEDELIAP